jgi:hypothetical protein
MLMMLPSHRTSAGKRPKTEHRGISDVVDGDDLEVCAALVRRAQDAAADATEAVDGDAGRHGRVS